MHSQHCIAAGARHSGVLNQAVNVSDRLTLLRSMSRIRVWPQPCPTDLASPEVCSAASAAAENGRTAMTCMHVIVSGSFLIVA